MQHIEAIEKIGDQIDKLSLIRSYTDLNGSDGLSTGFFLDHIFQQCPQFKEAQTAKFYLTSLRSTQLVYQHVHYSSDIER